jgi:hypothetical protein
MDDPRRSVLRASSFSPALILAIGIILIFLAAYPRLRLLVKHILNLLNPPIESQAVSDISKVLPDDPVSIER